MMRALHLQRLILAMDDQSTRSLVMELLALLGTLMLLREKLHILETKIRIAEMEAKKNR
jgi:hypothetical protein